jgi:hypothetical protein
MEKQSRKVTQILRWMEDAKRFDIEADARRGMAAELEKTLRPEEAAQLANVLRSIA